MANLGTIGYANAHKSASIKLCVGSAYQAPGVVATMFSGKGRVISPTQSNPVLRRQQQLVADSLFSAE